MSSPTWRSSWVEYSVSRGGLIKILMICIIISNNPCTADSTSTTLNTKAEIYIGEPAPIEAHPYYVSIEAGCPYSCGGAIVSAHWIVTSVRCLQMKNATVRAGSSIWRQNGTEHHIEKNIPHEGYNMTPYGIPVNDIALIKVKEHFPFDRLHQPVSLSNKSSLTHSGTLALATGMASLLEDNNSRLVQAYMPIIELDGCVKAYESVNSSDISDSLPVEKSNYFKSLFRGKFCTKYNREAEIGPCHADYGNPLLIRDQLIGILTWHDKDCENTVRPAVFTRITDHYDWIRARVDFSDWRAYLAKPKHTMVIK